jgi:hypothetical protein
MRYCFGDYQLDTDRHALEHAGVPVHIAPWGRTLKTSPLDQGPARCALDAYVPRLITSPSS